MLRRIAFLCIDPWEGFLTPVCRSCVFEYYRWICHQVVLRNIRSSTREQIELYGESGLEEIDDPFSEENDCLQLIYVQSHRENILKKIFENADLVVMGIPGSKQEFEKIFMLLFPWKDEIVFLWDRQICRGNDFLRKVCMEYKLKENQLIELIRGRDGFLQGY